MGHCRIEQQIPHFVDYAMFVSASKNRGRFRDNGRLMFLDIYLFIFNFNFVNPAGYTVELQCATLAAVSLLHRFMETEFPGAILEEEHMVRVKYSLPQKTVSLAHVFASLEREKSHLGLEDYSVSQSTLEQVFLSLASRSTNPTQVLNKVYNNTMMG